MCQLRAKTGQHLVGRSTFEPFLVASYAALGDTHCRTLDNCGLSIATHMYIVIVCWSLNKTWFYYTAIIELASVVQASLLYYQMNSFLGFWLMPKNKNLESKDCHGIFGPTF